MATSNLDQYLTRLVSGYKGKQLAIVAAGGGVSVSRIALVPGSSRVLYDVSILYSEDATIAYIEREGLLFTAEKMVSTQVANDLYHATTDRLQDSCAIVAMTSSLTTNRHRKGENQAFIRVGEETWRLRLDKLPESVYSDTVAPWRDQQIAVKRQKEDELVAEVALKLATGFEAETLEGMKINGVLRRVSEVD